MRTRNRNTVIDTMARGAHTWSNTIQTCAGVTTHSGNVTGTPYSVVTSALYERITDTLGRGKVNPVVHRKMFTRISSKQEYGAYPYPAGNGNVISQGPGPWWVEAVQSFANTNIGWNVSSNSVLPGGWTVDSSQLDESSLINRLVDNAKQLKADVLLNLVEANQIWPSINSLAGALPTMAKNWLALRKVLSTASGAFLAYKFGLSPIVSDMMAIQRYLPRLKQDVIRHGNQDASRFSVSAELPCIFTAVAPGANRLEMTGSATKSPTVRYVLVVKPKTKYHTSFFKKADFFVSRFASSPASLAWELVPFSFVVDWFVDLRGTLNALDNVIGSSPFEVVGFSRSYSYGLVSQISYGNASYCGGGELFRSPVVTHECSHYERIPVTSQGFTPVWSPRFGKNQAAVSAALITQALTKL